jgi:hypothetical protein
MLNWNWRGHQHLPLNKEFVVPGKAPVRSQGMKADDARPPEDLLLSAPLHSRRIAGIFRWAATPPARFTSEKNSRPNSIIPRERGERFRTRSRFRNSVSRLDVSIRDAPLFYAQAAIHRWRSRHSGRSRRGLGWPAGGPQDQGKRGHPSACRLWITRCASSGTWNGASLMGADTSPAFRCAPIRRACCWRPRVPSGQ